MSLAINGNGTIKRLSNISGTKVSLTGAAIDLSAGTLFSKEITANTTLTVSNIPSNQSIKFVLELIGGIQYTITWFSGIVWEKGIPPKLENKLVVEFYSGDGGTTWFGKIIENITADAYWISILGNVNSDYGRKIKVDSSGNVYIAGDTNSQGAGLYDALVTKYNSSGTVEWQRTLGGSSNEQGYDITLDSSGNVYITGSTSSQGVGNGDVLIAKYDTSGTLQWQRTLGGAGVDYGYGIAVDLSGNVYITGYTNSQGAGDQDVLIAKYDTSGTIQWQRVLGGASIDRGNNIAVDSSGNVYVSGWTQSQGAGDDDAFIAKYDTSGTLQWQRTLGGASGDYGWGIAVDSSGNVYVAGQTYSQGAGSSDAFIAKYNTSGTLQWQKVLGGANLDYGFGIALDSSNNVYVTGGSENSNFYYDGLIAKYDTSGTLQWQRLLRGIVDTYIFGEGITVDSSGNVYVTGYTGSWGFGNDDIFVAKLPNPPIPGIYNKLMLVESSLTSATSTLTSATSTLTSSTSTLTDAASTLISQPSTLLSTTLYK